LLTFLSSTSGMRTAGMKIRILSRHGRGACRSRRRLRGHHRVGLCVRRRNAGVPAVMFVPPSGRPAPATSPCPAPTLTNWRIFFSRSSFGSSKATTSPSFSPSWISAKKKSETPTLTVRFSGRMESARKQIVPSDRFRGRVQYKRRPEHSSHVLSRATGIFTLAVIPADPGSGLLSTIRAA